MTTPAENEGKVGRPRVEVPVDRIVKLRDAGRPWRAIAREVRRGVTTLRRAYQDAKHRNSGEANE
jgi:DNA invertase Pin-like site-specific DNA recombinase